MLKKILFFAFAFMGITLNAQFFHFQNISVYPDQPTIYDSISIIDKINTPSSGFYLYSNKVDILGKEITITNCYYEPAGFDIHSFVYDTIPLGMLTSGTYHCTAYSRRYIPVSNNDPGTSCDTASLDSVTFNFLVSQYGVGIQSFALTNLTLSPNPATTTLYSSTSLHDLDLSITDVKGRICAAPHTDRDIDISALPAGVYCLRLQTRDGSIVVRRFVRE